VGERARKPEQEQERAVIERKRRKIQGSEGPMADPDDYWSAVLVVLVPVVVVAVCVIFIIMWCPWRRMRLFTLGGVTTLTRTLNYTCTMCQDSMEAGEKVRTLSCDHAFHCGGNARCERDIDQWLLTAEVMRCPLCRKSPYPVLPWKQPPPSSPAPSPSASEPALQQLPQTSSTQDLEKALLLPANDETLAEASSSTSAPPLAQTQLPRTSTPDLAGVLPLPADDEILPEASSSQ
jgi:hypothetical protein